uniref:MULE transposase domain-containing protein n=1 Tax=Plectus sambesii TaxID=2011161 RepID=A0A914WCF9_9BILA
MGATTLQNDGTYKLTYEGNILITLAVSDKPRRLHPVGVAIIGKTEDASAYERAFDAIATAMDLAGLPAFVPDTVMFDGDPCIMAAVASCFPNARRLNCYYHMKKQVQRKMGPKRVPKDCPLRYWYKGVALGSVSTNNGLESLHGRIKRFGTLRKRDAHRIVREGGAPITCGVELGFRVAAFSVCPPRTLSLEVKAFHWSEDPSHMEFVAPLSCVWALISCPRVVPARCRTGATAVVI